MAAFGREAAIGPTELSIAASDPKRTLVNVGNLHTILAIEYEYSVKTDQMDSWFGYQGDQLGNEVQWFEYHMGGAIVVGCFELVV